MIQGSQEPGSKASPNGPSEALPQGRGGIASMLARWRGEVGGRDDRVGVTVGANGSELSLKMLTPYQKSILLFSRARAG
jgi:hypothetical protein